MAARHQYVALRTSLPALPATPFGREALPISAIRLERRLGDLHPAHREALTALERLLDWRHLGKALPTDTYLRRFRAAEPQLAAHGVLDLVAVPLEMHTVVAALRRHARGEPAPAAGARWGFGPRLAHMRAHWDEPLLGVGAVFPWLAEARNHLQEHRPRELERLLLGERWRMLARTRRYGHFDFREVARYVLQWRLVAAWRRYNAEAAGRRLQAGIEQGLGHYRRLF
ncbi:hypothetical protein [Nitrococcus mobilis]|uniref:Uncharacterized protein n=1 Tax=Nitrococcus mobilis Nb-231 TaxID=314278 RepID=A4BRC5_9GAMM|nr:hypothetical protein [Nitrococcus mobilis]EAR21747.1 hypothetical protein NB231_03420 [Nitrococcus mobilis Nb-231]